MVLEAYWNFFGHDALRAICSPGDSVNMIQKSFLGRS